MSRTKNIVFRAMLIMAMLLIAVFAPSFGGAATDENGSVKSTEIANKNPPPPPPDVKNFVDPVTVKVREMKAKGMSDDEIVEGLKLLGMGYYPKTGATWLGITPTPEEMHTLPQRKYPFDDNSPSIVPNVNALASTQANQVMETVDFSYRGFTNYLKPGSMAIKTDETTDHVVTTHVGRGGHWTESGVYRTLQNTNWRKFTYDDDEGGWLFHSTTDANTYTKYQIFVTTTYESAGYKYNIWIDGNWVRSGHLPYYDNRVDQANEVWSGTNTWTPDTISAYYKDPFLYVGDSSAVWWDSNINTNWWFAPDPCPVKENHYISGSAWRYLTWVD